MFDTTDQVRHITLPDSQLDYLAEADEYAALAHDLGISLE